MQKSILFFSVLTIFVSGCGQGGWHEYANDEGKYAILMPAEPTEYLHAANTAVGFVDEHGVFCRVGDFVTYGAIWSVYPESANFKKNAHKHNDNARDRMISNMNGRLLNDRWFMYGGFPARDIELEVPHGKIYMKIYAIKQRLYQLYVIILREQTTILDADKYFESFRLLQM